MGTEDLHRRIHELEDELARARAEAETDPLTGCLNRRGWERALTREQDRCRRHDLGAVVVVLDLVGLKHINERDGHHAGDAAIRRCGKAIRRALRGHDLVARCGGDEFAALVVQLDAPDAESVRRRLVEVLEAEDVRARVGAAALTDGEGDLRAVWRAADRRMIAGKRATRDARA